MMELSTRARYGLRFMVELCREARESKPVSLARIARITGLPEAYLGQLAISLRTAELIRSVAGKGGGYLPARPPEQIRLLDVLSCLSGPVCVAECATNPHVCLNSCFCETRIVYVLLHNSISQALSPYTLADLIDRGWIATMMTRHAGMPYLEADVDLEEIGDGQEQGCPVTGASGTGSDR